MVSWSWVACRRLVFRLCQVVCAPRARVQAAPGPAGHPAGVAGTSSSSSQQQRLRVVALPEEALLCAGEPLSSTHVLAGRPPKPLLEAFAKRLRTATPHSSWVGPKGSDRRGDYRCRAVHGHEYTEEQLASILGGGARRVQAAVVVVVVQREGR